MIILTIRTDKPESEVGLYDNGEKLQYETWQAHRELSKTIHKKIEKLLKAEDKDWHDIGGLVVYAGPGSFTGLRIGMTVANTIANDLGIPITSKNGEDWIQDGMKSITKGKDLKLALPFYGRDPHITQQKK